MSSNTTKGSRVRTLRDLDLLEGSNSYKPSGSVPEMKLAHIPTLPNADACLLMLQRIRKEFYPIADKRGYSVLSVSEMCCCGDGLDHGVILEEQEGTTTTTKKRRRRRKRKVMARNVLGYNQTTSSSRRGGSRSGSTHTIHLRLRNAQNHSLLLPYEDVAGTMAHELAHCVHGAHNAKFYKLMDEIQEQHATFMIRGIFADDKGFPMHSKEAHVLGGTNPNGDAAAAAEARKKTQNRWMPQGPQKLGGDSSWKKWYTPGEAAAAAAEARRLEDEQWCQPCNEDIGVVELMDSSDEEEKTDQNQKLPSAINNRGKNIVAEMPISLIGDETSRIRNTYAAIDLTGDNDDEDNNNGHDASISISWSCQICTFLNEPQLLVCGMCRSEKSNLSEKLIAKLAHDDVAQSIRDEAIRRARALEVKQAKEEFGFNIYGDESSKRIATSTMKHIT